jgi:hypothetical protein
LNRRTTRGAALKHRVLCADNAAAASSTARSNRADAVAGLEF